jgi:voltage-gated potassium channel
MEIPTADLQYVTSFEEILWGGTLVAITMALHGLGVLSILRVNGVLKERFEPNASLAKGIAILILTSWLIMALHLGEVVVWAAFFLWKGAFPNQSLAYYFSLNEYTTLGSNYNLPLRWRLLEGMIATAGLLTFAWSTGLLLTLAQEFQEQQLLLIKQRRGRTRSKTAEVHGHGADNSKLI